MVAAIYSFANLVGLFVSLARNQKFVLSCLIIGHKRIACFGNDNSALPDVVWNLICRHGLDRSDNCYNDTNRTQDD